MESWFTASNIWLCNHRSEPVRWTKDATDQQIVEHMGAATAFLSSGIEGYGIPVLEAIRRGLPVAFDGIQPAAGLMEGHGAIRVPTDAKVSGWENAIAQAQVARAELDPNAVPTWRDFARSVAQARADSA